MAGQIKMWRFKNLTTGKLMECNDLGFLMHQLREIQGLNIPHPEVQKLMFEGKINCSVIDVDDEVNEIYIEEYLSEIPIGKIC